MENKELETKLDIRTSKDFIEWIQTTKKFSNVALDEEPKTLVVGGETLAAFSEKNDDLFLPFIYKLYTFADGVEWWDAWNGDMIQKLLKEWKELNNG